MIVCLDYCVPQILRLIYMYLQRSHILNIECCMLPATTSADLNDGYIRKVEYFVYHARDRMQTSSSKVTKDSKDFKDSNNSKIYIVPFNWQRVLLCQRRDVCLDLLKIQPDAIISFYSSFEFIMEFVYNHSMPIPLTKAFENDIVQYHTWTIRESYHPNIYGISLDRDFINDDIVWQRMFRYIYDILIHVHRQKTQTLAQLALFQKWSMTPDSIPNISRASTSSQWQSLVTTDTYDPQPALSMTDISTLSLKTHNEQNNEQNNEPTSAEHPASTSSVSPTLSSTSTISLSPPRPMKSYKSTKSHLGGYKSNKKSNSSRRSKRPIFRPKSIYSKYGNVNQPMDPNLNPFALLDEGDE